METLSSVHQRGSEIRKEEDEIVAKNMRENEIVRQARIAEEQKVKDAENAKREEQRLKEEETLKDQIRYSFMSGNPSATVEDFDRAYPSLRDDHFKRNTENDLQRQLESNRSKYNMF